MWLFFLVDYMTKLEIAVSLRICCFKYQGIALVFLRLCHSNLDLRTQKIEIFDSSRVHVLRIPICHSGGEHMG